MPVPLVDLHLHLLPGLDDGPLALADAVALARRAAAGGTEIAVCTPHLVPGRWPNGRRRVEEAVARLQRALDEAGVPLRLLPGCEAYAHPDLPDLLDAGEVATLAGQGRHLLLELPVTALPPGFDRFLFDLQQRGLVIVLAHPERYLPVQRRPELAGEWATRGVLLQLNAAHLLDAGDRAAFRTARRLLERGWAHLIASDGHSRRRPPDLGPALARLAAVYGRALAEQARANAFAVVGEGAGELEPLRVGRRRWWWPWG